MARWPLSGDCAPASGRRRWLAGHRPGQSQFLDNLAQFVAGHPANHTLLTGARGTGKSSLVKAGLARFADAGLRGIEVSPHDLTDLPDIVARCATVKNATCSTSTTSPSAVTTRR